MGYFKGWTRLRVIFSLWLIHFPRKIIFHSSAWRMELLSQIEEGAQGRGAWRGKAPALSVCWLWLHHWLQHTLAHLQFLISWVPCYSAFTFADNKPHVSARGCGYSRIDTRLKRDRSGCGTCHIGSPRKALWHVVCWRKSSPANRRRLTNPFMPCCTLLVTRIQIYIARRWRAESEEGIWRIYQFD